MQKVGLQHVNEVERRRLLDACDSDITAEQQNLDRMLKPLWTVTGRANTCQKGTYRLDTPSTTAL